MSVYYVIHKNTNSKVGKQGKFYAKAKTMTTITTKQLCEIVERNTTAKAADVRAVLTELVETVTLHVQRGERVCIDGLGWFKLSVQSKPADTRKLFNAREHIKGVRVIYSNERTTDASGRSVYELLDGVTAQELPAYKNNEE